MPLPDTLTSAQLPWPPPAVAGATPKLAEWASWWGGDGDDLAAQYSPVAGLRMRPSQYRGGVVGGIARMFWGAPTPIGSSRAKLHVPIASDIATASADLLFAETVKVTPPDGTTLEQGQRLETILDGIAWDSFLPEQAEAAAALGGVYHRIVWDQQLADHPIVTAVHADCAWPEFWHGRLRACTFWDDLVARDDYRLRILERHELGRIEWGVYEGTRDKLGRRVDFGALTNLGMTPPDVDDQSGIDTGLGVPLTATYVPNMRPQRLKAWRLDAQLANLGRSDFDSIEPLFDAADETMSSWMRDLRLGKGRIIVPEWMLQNSGRGEGGGSFFNVDQEAFVSLNAAVDANEGMAQQITVQQFALRTQEHADTLAGILAAAFRGAGYSQQTFGIAGEAEGAATATEVNARESRSNRTREKKSRYFTDALPRTLAALLAVDEVHFQGHASATGWAPTVEFPDVTRPDAETEARSIQTLRAAEVMSIYTGVKRVHPDWDDQLVQEEVQRIYADQKALTPALPDLGALPGDPNADPNPDAPPPGLPANVG